MTLENRGNRRVFMCDHKGCAQGTDYFHPADIRAASHKAKQEGWLVIKGRGKRVKWQHFCPFHADEHTPRRKVDEPPEAMTDQQKANAQEFAEAEDRAANIRRWWD